MTPSRKFDYTFGYVINSAGALCTICRVIGKKNSREPKRMVSKNNGFVVDHRETDGHSVFQGFTF